MLTLALAPAAGLCAYGCAIVGGIKAPLPAHCTDGVKNGDESAVDCGGSCGKCEGETCAGGDECASGLCNGTRDQCSTPADTDVCPPGMLADDCRVCHTCPNGDVCVFAADCASGSCKDGTCAVCEAATQASGFCLDVTCANGVKDNGEVGVDCGGPCPKACGSAGADAGDDASMDGGGDAADAGEDAADAGEDASLDAGDGAADAGDDASLDAGDDAATDAGNPGVPCMDGKKDGDESDVDCGGSCTKKCGLGKMCNVKEDCLGNLCINNACE